MRVFVAGASGAVGRQMVPLLLRAGHFVSAISRNEQSVETLRALGVDATVCDIYDRERLIAILRGVSPDAVIDQLTDLPASMDPKQLASIYARNNRIRLEGTRHLLDAAEQSGVRRFVVQSMATWYKPEGSPIKSETDPLWLDASEPLGTAVRALAGMESEVSRRAAIAVVLRYGAFYGPGTWYAADGEIAIRMRSRGFPIIGSGQAITSFIHVADAASAAVAALEAPGTAVYNVTDDDPAPASAWIPAYAAAVGAPRPLTVPAFVARLALGRALTDWLTSMRGASNATLKSELGWRPARSSWRDGFRELQAGP